MTDTPNNRQEYGTIQGIELCTPLSRSTIVETVICYILKNCKEKRVQKKFTATNQVHYVEDLHLKVCCSGVDLLDYTGIHKTLIEYASLIHYSDDVLWDLALAGVHLSN